MSATAMNENVSRAPQRVGVVGTGVMGAPMAGSLLRAGFRVGVFNRTLEKCAPLQALGATVAPSPASLAKESEVLILMLADDQAVEHVVLNPDGILAGGREGLIVLNSSTVHPATNQRLAGKLGESGITLLDAPVTGRRPQAQASQLYFLVGGDSQACERCFPVFQAMGRGHIHLGPVGAGACAKLANNFMGFINLCGLAEALKLVTAAGLAPDKFLEALSSSGGRSAVSEAKGPKILREDWSPDFALALAAKDLRIAWQLAEELRQPSPLLAQATQVLTQAAAEFGRDDVCGLVRWYDRLQGALPHEI